MICVSLGEPTAEDCINALEGIQFAEIRLDKMDITPADIEKIFSSHPNLIATCRPAFLDREKRLEYLSTAVSSGAAYVDIELEADEEFKNSILKVAGEKGCRVIVSFHDFNRTPDKPELEQIVHSCFNAGSDIAKIACKVHTDKDNVRLLSLLEEERPLVVIGLGSRGRVTRLAAPLLGSPFTYASLSERKETAEGQLDRESIKTLLKALKNV
jgi:3-dehydroquinate dehydratase-1